MATVVTVNLATLGLGGTMVPFAGLAISMVAFQLVLLRLFLPRSSEPTRPRLSRAIVVAYLLPASALMWLVLPGAVLRPSYDSWWAAIQAMMVPMPAPFLWFMSQVFQAEERPIDRRGALWPVLLAAAALANEGLMGYAFAALSGAPGLSDPATVFALSLNSPWFAAAMIATMVGLLVWIPLPSWQRLALAGVAASSLAGPLWLIDPLACAVVLGAVMVATLLVVVRGLTASSALPPSFVRFAWGIGGAMGAMTFAGALVTVAPSVSANGLPFAISGAIVMFVELSYLVHAGLSSIADPTPWPTTPLGASPLTA